MRDLRTLALLLGLAIVASGQIVVSFHRTPEGGTATYRLIGSTPPVLGAPVSYELLEVRVTPSRGTQITNVDKLHRFWRDAKGRTRLEQFYVGPQSETNPRLLIWPVAEVVDPVAGSWYVLELEKKIAHRSALAPPTPTLPSVGVTAVLPPGAEDLGTQTINGVLAQGYRITATVPADAQGDCRQLVLTRETWTSPELQIPMLMKIHDPRAGDLTMNLQNVSRAEPAASLFAPPADYRIVDENGEFTVTWGTPPQALAPPPPPPVPLSQGISGAGYRIGGGVSAPVPIYQPEPQYTEEARKAGIQGTVLLSIVVDENGQAQAIRVTRSLDPELDQKAIEAVSQWRFRPGQKDGKPVPVMASVEVNFRLP